MRGESSGPPADTSSGASAGAPTSGAPNSSSSGSSCASSLELSAGGPSKKNSTSHAPTATTTFNAAAVINAPGSPLRATSQKPATSTPAAAPRLLAE